MQTCVYTKTFTWMFIATLFIIDKNWKWSKYPAGKWDNSSKLDEWIIDTCGHMEEARKYNAKWKQPNTNEHYHLIPPTPSALRSGATVIDTDWLAGSRGKERGLTAKGHTRGSFSECWKCPVSGSWWLVTWLRTCLKTYQKFKYLQIGEFYCMSKSSKKPDKNHKEGVKMIVMKVLNTHSWRLERLM